jgi:ankyrin repeat protein
MLLKSGASVSAVDNIGWTPLGFAALNGHTQAAGTLMDAGSDLSWINSNHVSILMAASIGGNGELVRFLINQGVDVNAVAKDHSTALIFAAKHGRIEVAKILYIEAKADSTIQDVQNQTAENYACTNQHQEICELLRISSQPPVEQ